jgi:hypothetical protein
MERMRRVTLLFAAAGLAVCCATTAETTDIGSNPVGVLFESNWDTAIGTSKRAVTDGGRWPLYDEFNRKEDVQLLDVVPGGPNGHNALRVLQRGSKYAANLQKKEFAPPSTDFYVRFYMRNDDTSPAGDHIVTPDIYKYPNLTYMRKRGTASDWSFVIGVYGCVYTYPIGFWGPQARLALGRWYRFEDYVHYTSANRIQVHSRVYDDSGKLLFSDADFLQSDPRKASWSGRSNWTLASYYAAGYDFCVDPQFMTTFGVGNNGQEGSTDTGMYWYFAGVQIRSDKWPGAIDAMNSGR